MPKGWPKGKPKSLEWRMKMSEAQTRRRLKEDSEKLDAIYAQLKSNGVLRIKDVEAYRPRLIKRYADKFMLLHIYWAGGFGSRGGIQKGSRFIKTEFMGKKFLGLKSDRTALVRFFMTVFREDREYEQYDAKVINNWLKRYDLTRAERVAVITKLGYKYKKLKHIMINGYLDQKPMAIRGRGRQSYYRPELDEELPVLRISVTSRDGNRAKCMTIYNASINETFDKIRKLLKP